MNIVLIKNIIATVVYYDVLDYPLTTFEIWKHLINTTGSHYKKLCTIEEVARVLSSQAILQYIDHKNGFYFLCGREELVEKRKIREIISFSKSKKLQRIVAVLRVAPFVRMVCVTGRLAYKNCDSKSDLDVLVLYESGHIWTGRFFLTVFAHICGVRRYGKKTTDRLCLNYHITTQSCAVPTRDLFAAHEYSFILPIFDISGMEFQQFCRDNQWIKEYKPQYNTQYKSSFFAMKHNFVTQFIQKFLELILSDRGMERRLRAMQIKKIEKNENTYKKGALILYNDAHLVFLPHPHGPEVFEEYKKRFDALELNF